MAKPPAGEYRYLFPNARYENIRADGLIRDAAVERMGIAACCGNGACNTSLTNSSDNYRDALAHGASRWNPIEHRLFSRISGNCMGQPLNSYETVLKLIRTTKTATGLVSQARFDR